MEIEGQEVNPEAAMYAELNAIRNGETELPQGHVGDEQAEPEAHQQAAEQSEDTEVQKVIYDGQEFSSEKEAYEYMQRKVDEVEREKLILEARQEGMESALYSRQEQTVAELAPPQEEDDSEDFYADPTGYMKKQTAKIEEQIRQRLRLENEAAEADRREWNDFFTRHPDLSDFKEDCQHALTQNLETIKILAAKDKKKAQDFLATKAREKFQRYIEAAKPRTQLANSHNAASSGVYPSGVTPAKSSQAENESLDMISQIRNMRR